MGVTRKWIFPILRLIIFGAIAAALVKVAFFGEATATTDPAVPTGEITQAEVAVTTGTIVNDTSRDASRARPTVTSTCSMCRL